MPRFRAAPDLSALPGVNDSEPGNTERLRIILESWLESEVSSAASDTDGSRGATLVATVMGSESGFVAAVSIDGVPRLLAAFGDRIDNGLAMQIERCETIDGAETSSDPTDVARVFGMIRDWRNAEKAAQSAGVGASGAQRRKEITNRIDTLVEAAPPHLRAARLAAASRAREIATTPQCAAVERELEGLLDSGLDPDQWLAAIAKLDVRQAPDIQSPFSRRDPVVHAILIARVRPRRFRSPLAPESP
jgi:hypothetical protein